MKDGPKGPWITAGNSLFSAFFHMVLRVLYTSRRKRRSHGTAPASVQRRAARRTWRDACLSGMRIRCAMGRRYAAFGRSHQAHACVKAMCTPAREAGALPLETNCCDLRRHRACMAAAPFSGDYAAQRTDRCGSGTLDGCGGSVAGDVRRHADGAARGGANLAGKCGSAATGIAPATGLAPCFRGPSRAKLRVLRRAVHVPAQFVAKWRFYTKDWHEKTERRLTMSDKHDYSSI